MGFTRRPAIEHNVRLIMRDDDSRDRFGGRGPDNPAEHDPMRYRARVPSSQIGYVNAIVESYEGMGIMRTRDPKAGRVDFWVFPKFERDFLRMIEGLRGEFPVAFLPGAPEPWERWRDELREAENR